MRRVTVLAGIVLGLTLAAGRGAAQESHGTDAAEKRDQIQHETEDRSGHSVESPEGHAAEGHGEEHVVPWYNNQDLWKGINLLVLFYIGLRMGGRGLGGKLRQRSAGIRTELDEARLTLESVEKRLDDAEYRLARLHDELEELRREGQQTAQSEKERLIADAHAAAAEMGRRTKEQVQLETQRAKRELRAYMASLIVERVREDLKQRVERQGDAPFVNTILEKVESLA